MDLTLDLELTHYTLPDLLHLFHLPYDFTNEDLKKAKKMVLQTHPDKSDLPKEYFLFFSAAFKMVFGIYNFRHQKPAHSGDTAYAALLAHELDQSEQVTPITSSPEFQVIFNRLFEQHRVQDEETRTGYGDWLGSNDDMDTRSATMANMHATFETKKNELKALVPVRAVADLDSGRQLGSDLSREKPEYYSSALFSNTLAYEDLKKAHVESVIPITHADYLARPKFNSTDDLLRDAQYNAVQPLSLQQSQSYLKERDLLQARSDVTRAFVLAQHAERAQQANQGFRAAFQQLTL
jgi:hypothetical protein